MDLKQYPVLQRLANQHEKRIDKFQAEASKFFHPHAVKLCRRIQKGIPEFTGCQLAMRMLFLYPADLRIPVVNYNGEDTTERLGNIMDYVTIKDGWTVKLPARTIEALVELDKLADYIDDNYSMVSELVVDLPKENP